MLFIEQSWYEKMFSFHKTASLLPRMLISQAPCFEKQEVTQLRTVLCGVGDHKKEMPTSKSQISAKQNVVNNSLAKYLHINCSKIMPNKQIYKNWSLLMDNLQT